MGLEGNDYASKYKEEYAGQARKLCLLGAIDTDLADFFEVARSTISLWKNDHPEFGKALSEAKREADAKVVRSLYQRATGYSHPEEKVFCYEGGIVTHNTIKQYAPDTAAGIFWLKNRQKDEWKDKQEIDHKGGITINMPSKDASTL